MKTQWAASTIYARDSLYSQASDLGSNWVQGLPLDADEQLIFGGCCGAVTPEQVQAVARSTLATTSSPWRCFLPPARWRQAQTPRLPADGHACTDRGGES